MILLSHPYNDPKIEKFRKVRQAVGFLSYSRFLHSSSTYSQGLNFAMKRGALVLREFEAG